MTSRRPLPDSSDKDNLQTTLFSGEERPPAEERKPRPGTGLLTLPWRILMQIGGQSRTTTVGLEVRDQITIGRADPTEAFMPDLDLTPYGGQEGGVSRRHALIRHHSQALFLEDLHSANGTYLNRGAVLPGRQYRLRDGDEIELGRVRLAVRFVRPPR
jgi:hypothetical protein